MDDDNDSRFWLIGLGVAVLAVFLIHALQQPVPPATSAPSAPVTTPDTVTASPQPATSADNATTRRDPPVITSVYECQVGTQHIYSDHRCGTTSTIREIHAPNGMAAQDTRILEVPVAAAEPTPVAAPSAPAASVEGECSQLELEKNHIDALMREGYTSHQGEQYRALLRRIGNRWHELRCKHFRSPDLQFLQPNLQ